MKRQHKKIFLHSATTHWREMPSTKTAETAQATPDLPHVLGCRNKKQHPAPDPRVHAHHLGDKGDLEQSTSPGGVSPKEKQHKHLVPALCYQPTHSERGQPANLLQKRHSRCDLEEEQANSFPSKKIQMQRH